MSPQAAATTVLEAYERLNTGRWIRLADIMDAGRLRHADLIAGVKHLLAECDGVRTEPIFIPSLIKPDDREAAVVIAGEPHHMIRIFD